MPGSGIATPEPLRTCIGCRSSRPQRDLHRCVLSADGSPRLSRTAPGRGAWICSVECARRAVRRGGFARAWRRNVGTDALDTLVETLTGALAGSPAGTLVTTPENMRQSRAAGHRAGAPSPTKG